MVKGKQNNMDYNVNSRLVQPPLNANGLLLEFGRRPAAMQAGVGINDQLKSSKGTRWSDEQNKSKKKMIDLVGCIISASSCFTAEGAALLTCFCFSFTLCPHFFLSQLKRRFPLRMRCKYSKGDTCIPAFRLCKEKVTGHSLGLGWKSQRKQHISSLSQQIKIQSFNARKMSSESGHTW